jgi:hypothetical protein
LGTASFICVDAGVHADFPISNLTNYRSLPTADDLSFYARFARRIPGFELQRAGILREARVE